MAPKSSYNLLDAYIVDILVVTSARRLNTTKRSRCLLMLKNLTMRYGLAGLSVALFVAVAGYSAHASQLSISLTGTTILPDPCSQTPPPPAGTVCPDGTISTGTSEFMHPSALGGPATFYTAVNYCRDLVSLGYDDWDAPRNNGWNVAVGSYYSPYFEFCGTTHLPGNRSYWHQSGWSSGYMNVGECYGGSYSDRESVEISESHYVKCVRER